MVRAPKLQRALTKVFQANVFFFPYGAFYMPGAPRQTPVVVAAGKKVLVPPIGHPTPDQVNEP